MTQEALSSLKALGNQLRLQLLESPEFRALAVVDRTIMELTQILNAAAPEAPDQVAPVVAEQPAREPTVAAPIVEPRLETPASAPTSSQSRMAKAIAEAIAAKAMLPVASSAATPHFMQGLSAAS
jgi:hypothetical protein